MPDNFTVKAGTGVLKGYADVMPGRMLTREERAVLKHAGFVWCRIEQCFRGPLRNLPPLYAKALTSGGSGAFPSLPGAGVCPSPLKRSDIEVRFRRRITLAKFREMLRAGFIWHKDDRCWRGPKTAESEELLKRLGVLK